jgi:hypothetical protein
MALGAVGAAVVVAANAYARVARPNPATSIDALASPAAAPIR